jgi:hypothetical protein
MFSSKLSCGWAHHSVWALVIILKFQFGGTTNREVMLAGTVITRIFDHSVVYIADGKLTTKGGAPSNLYEKLFVGLNKKGSWNLNFRIFRLVACKSSFVLARNIANLFPIIIQLFISPFYDPVRNAVGAETGFSAFS